MASSNPSVASRVSESRRSSLRIAKRTRELGETTLSLYSKRSRARTSTEGGSKDDGVLMADPVDLAVVTARPPNLSSTDSGSVHVAAEPTSPRLQTYFEAINEMTQDTMKKCQRAIELDTLFWSARLETEKASDQAKRAENTSNQVSREVQLAEDKESQAGEAAIRAWQTLSNAMEAREVLFLGLKKFYSGRE